MSTYYILVNKEKREWIDSGDLGLGLKDTVYEYRLATLLGYLMLDKYGGGSVYEQYNPKEHILEPDDDTKWQTKVNFYFSGHWAGDKGVQLVSEHDPLYEILGRYSHDQEEANLWVNISKPLAREWNHNIKDWYEDSPDMQDWVKQHLYEGVK